MFGFQQAAAQFTPQIYCTFTCGGSCHVCTGTCCDTGLGTGCWGSCGYGSHTTYLALMAQVNPGDPVEQLSTLRKGLESALAGIAAQEKALRERAGESAGS